MSCRQQTQFQLNTSSGLMEKTALKIRHLVEAMDEEEISFHEQKAQNLVIETGLAGIESAKRNYNDTTQLQNALMEIELKKPALMVYTDGSIMRSRRRGGKNGRTGTF
jgi:nitrate reductase alpha subunit